MIFRHEFIQLVYLRENGYDTKIYRKNDTKYVPDSTKRDCQNCCLSLNESGKRFICDSSEMKEVEVDLQN